MVCETPRVRNVFRVRRTHHLADFVADKKCCSRIIYSLRSRSHLAATGDWETLTARPDDLDAISPRRGRQRVAVGERWRASGEPSRNPRTPGSTRRPADRLNRDGISECPGSCRSLRERFSCYVTGKAGHAWRDPLQFGADSRRVPSRAVTLRHGPTPQAGLRGLGRSSAAGRSAVIFVKASPWCLAAVAFGSGDRLQPKSVRASRCDH